MGERDQILIAGNWKMNLNPAEGSVLLHRLDDAITANDAVEVVLCPPYLAIPALHQEADKSKFKLGAQDLHYLDHGPYTGEISGSMLKGLVDYVIVGHSERRKAGEGDKIIAKKVAAAFRNGMTPILCVGDTLVERQHNAAKKVVVDQLTAACAQLTDEEVAGLVVAYEPVWAIGSGEFARTEDVRVMAKTIRHTLEELYGEQVGATVRVLYGGSVVPDNTKSYLKTEGVRGLLVGGASLNYEQFGQIVRTAQELAD